jgi:hypothetical protein
MTPDSTADYDLYTKWPKLTCPTLTDTDCGFGFSGPGQQEGCGALLSAGTYYVMINHFEGAGGYSLNLNCLMTTTTSTTSATTTTLSGCTYDMDCCQIFSGPCATKARCSSGSCICGVGSACPV